MTTYRYDKITIDTDNPNHNAQLEALHARAARLLCTCVEPPLEMYLARTQAGIIVKRMPDTGPRHAPTCPSYEPPAELGGLAPLLGQAIVENPDTGTTILRLGFPLSRRPGRPVPTPDNPSTPGDTAKTQPRKLTLRGLLHYLWEEARLTHWTPKWTGRRSWRVVQSHLLQAASSKATSTNPLPTTLYVPEPFTAEQKDPIANRRRAHIAKTTTAHTSGGKPLMILIGDVKEIIPSHTAFKIVVKHAPDFHFGLSTELHTNFEKRFARETALWNKDPANHLIIAATFSMTTAGYANIEDVTTMAANANWIPIEAEEDERLIAALTASNRSFFRVLRYSPPPSAPTATAVVVDTTPQPVALYLLPADTDNTYRDNLITLATESRFAPWFWETSAITMPELPTLNNYAPMPLPVLETA